MKSREPAADPSLVQPAFTERLSVQPIPSLRMPAEENDPEVAYRFIHDELMLDGNSRLNLATFVTTWMDDEAERLMSETVSYTHLTLPTSDLV